MASPHRSPSELEARIRQQVRAYVDGRLSFTQLDRWLAAHSWEPSILGDQQAGRLLRAVRLRLGEYATAYWTEEELRTVLRALLQEREPAS